MCSSAMASVYRAPGANAARLTPYRPADIVAVVERRFEFAFPSKRRRSLMRTRMGIGVISLLAVQTVYAADVPITSNPIPEPIVKRGIAVEVVDLARLPDTRGIRPADQDVKPAGWARVNYVRDLPDGRRFANDSRGFLYLIDSKQSAARVRESGGDVSACGLQPARAADSSRSPSIRSSRETACSTPCTRSTGRAIRRSPTSFRPGTD